MGEPATVRVDDDAEPDPGAAKMMEMVDRLPPEFRALVYEYGYEMVSRRLPYKWVEGLCISLQNDDKEHAPHHSLGQHHHTNGVSFKKLAEQLASDRTLRQSPEYKESEIKIDKELAP